MKVLLLLVVLSLLLIRTNAISFSLEPESQKCLREEVHKNVLVVGDYEIEMIYGQRTDVEVVDSKGHTLFRKEDASDGKFAFTTEDYEIFDVCFKSYTNHGQTGNQPSRTIVLNLKHGVEAKDYQDIGKVEKLKPMELELKRLEDLTEAIVNDFSYMRAREEEMRDTNESTNTRVLYFSIFSMCCLLFLAGWQVFYLKRFFKAKKLIE